MPNAPESAAVPSICNRCATVKSPGRAPSQPCLSSRIPHGTPVTPAALAMVERGEAHVRSLGFRVFRVRHIVGASSPARARVQIAPEEMPRLAGIEPELVRGLRAAGYAEVEIDPAGYRSPA